MRHRDIKVDSIQFRNCWVDLLQLAKRCFLIRYFYLFKGGHHAIASWCRKCTYSRFILMFSLISERMIKHFCSLSFPKFRIVLLGPAFSFAKIKVRIWSYIARITFLLPFLIEYILLSLIDANFLFVLHFIEDNLVNVGFELINFTLFK